MSVRLRVEAVLLAHPERVWAVLTDWERQVVWMPDVAWIRVAGEERGLGARLEVRTKVLGLPLTTDIITVTIWEPPSRLGVEHMGVIRGSGVWTLESVAAGTRFEWTESIQLPGGVFGDAAFRVYEPIQRWMLRRSIENLRRLAEA